MTGPVWFATAQLGTGEASQGLVSGTSRSSPGKVDLNHATAEELVRLPGISVDVADRIIRHRPYKKLDDLVTRKVLGKKEFARIREQVVVGRAQR
jgi:DNA uptake protein ComE-like DNA-binding protein